MIKKRVRQITLVALVGIGVTGCDKCGHPLKLDTPTIQHACYDDSGSQR